MVLFHPHGGLNNLMFQTIIIASLQDCESNLQSSEHLWAMLSIIVVNVLHISNAGCTCPVSIAGILLSCKIEVICWNTLTSGGEIIPHKLLVRRPTTAELV